MDSVVKCISIMGICNKLVWLIFFLFFVFLIGKEVSDIIVLDLFIFFYVIIVVFIILGIILLMVLLFEVKVVGEDDSEGGVEVCLYVVSKILVW